MKSSQRRKVLFILGTRPEAIKLAPVILAVRERKDLFVCRLAVTAQHRKLLDDVLSVFGMKPDHDLKIMRHGQTLTDISVRSLSRLDAVLNTEKPDIVVVQGDTTTALMAALSATYHRIPVAHVEAGLRSGDSQDPFPEEINRALIDRLSVLLFAPTPTARRNLLAEGYTSSRIVVTGNTAIDALRLVRAGLSNKRPRLPAGVDAALARACAVLTIHRRENRGDALNQILLGVRDFARSRPDRTVVCPMHPNPELRRVMREKLGRTANIALIESLPYDAMIYLLERALFIVTDSGGLQEEAPEMGKPVLIVRRNSERPEGLRAGTAKIIGNDRRSVARWMGILAQEKAVYQRMARVVHPYGDGNAAARVVKALKSFHW